MRNQRKAALALPLATLLSFSCSDTDNEQANEPNESRSNGEPANTSREQSLANSPTRDITAPSYVPRRGALRLTRAELDATLRDVFKVNNGLTQILAEDEYSPFDNALTTQSVSGALAEGLQVLAEQVASEVTSTESRDQWMPCTPKSAVDRACFGETVRKLGLRLLRRPISDSEGERYAGLLEFAKEQNDFYAAVTLLVETLLQDPEFIYRVERGSATTTPEVYALGVHEIATRLSFLLLGTGPSEELLADASLSDSASRGAAASRLLDDPRARQQLNRFHAMWLGYRAIPHDAKLNAALQKETESLIERVLLSDVAPISQLFTSPETHLTDELADHYGLPRPEGGEGWVAYPAESGRRGILSHGSVLSGFSKFTDTSPTQRGIFVQTRLLCNPIPPPPPTVDVDQPPSAGEPGCKVERYQAHQQQSGCAECHSLFDPIGLGLENFDRSGRFREHDDEDEECLITTSGTLPGFGEFRGPGELSELLVSNELVEGCFAQHYARFAGGTNKLDEFDKRYISHLQEQLRANNGIVKQWLVALVADPAFGLRRDSLEEK